MIGVFDSGHGGLTVFEALVRRFPDRSFTYLGDHANAPYGDRPSAEIVAFTRHAVETLFGRGCRLVLLGCNTATAVASRTLQREWLPGAGWPEHNVLGIVAPTVEAATQTAWGVTTPQYPQKYNTDVIAVFGTTRTIDSGVYPEEIRKRCPQVTVAPYAVPGLVGAIERSDPEPDLEALVADAVARMMSDLGGEAPHRAILGCTHFPLVEHLFRRHLPPTTRILSQPVVVADSLEDYLARHPEYDVARGADPIVLTTGDVDRVTEIARVLWADVPPFAGVAVAAP
ncbi:MAG TPA: aspartate/glutamate racemase family protein [Acidimicrobiia bacterium]|nr:aspartate/glutamate racemase family protein [Acidimicrobiia bacterium]